MQPGDPVHIEYIRPGKGIANFVEEFVAQDEVCLRTHVSLTEDVIESLSRALSRQALIAPYQQVVTLTKAYFFHEPFNLLAFFDRDENLLGHYSDIGEFIIQQSAHEFRMIDLYLDIWLFPDGRLIELDWDEFEEAIKLQVITPAQADLARTAMQRLVGEVKQGIYPGKYLA